MKYPFFSIRNSSDNIIKNKKNRNSKPCSIKSFNFESNNYPVTNLFDE